MRIDTEFAISRPPAEAYSLLLDLERVAPCFPGAELMGHLPDGAREVRVTVRLGPMRLAYEGEVHIDERHDDALRAVMAGSAREARGAGSASARIAMRVEPSGTGSRVVAEADVDLSGRAAQMGKGIVEDVARRLVGEMGGCLEAGLAAQAPSEGPPPTPSWPAPAEPIRGGRLVLGIARERLRDPRVAAAALAGVALLLLRVSMGSRRRRRNA